MKRLSPLVSILLGAILFIPSCQKVPFITMTGPRSYSFSREGGSQTIAFSCNRDWSVSSSESWVRVSPSSGSASDGDITITLTVSPNSTYDPRTATLTVKVEELMETITVTQETGLGLIVSPTTFNLTNAEQTIEVEVQKNVNYIVNIDDACKDWIKNAGTKALSSEKVIFNISANTSYDDREGKITFLQTDGTLSQTVTVRQSQTNGLFITTPEYNLSNEAHTLSVEVKANVEFEVTSQAEWIKFVETKALTPSTITLNIEANESYDNRTGSVLVKQKNGELTGTITINQKQTDYLSVTPTSFEVSNESQTVTIDVKDNIAYSVVIPDAAKEWISVTSNTQTKALVDDKVVLSITQNTTYDDRKASITIKQVDGSLSGTVKISQEAATTPEIIDLGLSVKWASVNIGALTPVEVGNYYAWGELAPKDDYSWDNYRWHNAEQVTKYNNSNSSFGPIDNKTELDLEDDIAHVSLGEKWRIPKAAEWQELLDNCTWTWSTNNGTTGVLIKSKINGNSIFLPAAGYVHSTEFNKVGSSGFYRSASLWDPLSVYGVAFTEDSHYLSDGFNRYVGFSIRPVTE